jgi:hypothetical protein
VTWINLRRNLAADALLCLFLFDFDSGSQRLGIILTVFTDSIMANIVSSARLTKTLLVLWQILTSAGQNSSERVPKSVASVTAAAFKRSQAVAERIVLSEAREDMMGEAIPSKRPREVINLDFMVLVETVVEVMKCSHLRSWVLKVSQVSSDSFAEKTDRVSWTRTSIVGVVVVVARRKKERKNEEGKERKERKVAVGN